MPSFSASPAADKRRGLNCTLSYPKGKANVAYRVRCTDLIWGFEMVADESQSRTTRAYYPHMVAPSRFSITLALIGQAERDSLNGYLMRYANYILDAGIAADRTPQITVSIPSRKFQQVGTPLTGLEYGVHVGAMVYAPTLTFETSGGPLDWSDPYAISSIQGDLAYYKSPDSKYFYPTGTQLAGGDAPTAPSNVTDPVQAAINGASAPDSTDPTNATVAERDAGFTPGSQTTLSSMFGG